MDKMEMKPPPKEDTDTNLTDWRALVRPEFRQSVINRIALEEELMESTEKKKLRELGGSLPVENVQALAVKGLDEIPDRYIRPELESEVVCCGESMQVPVIDLSRLLCQQSSGAESEKLHSTCLNWGFFQLVNHGVAEEIIEKIKIDIQEFFSLPLEEKKAFSKEANHTEGYGQLFVVSEEQKLDWADMLFLQPAPVLERNMRFWPTTPASFRESFDKYTSELRKIATCLTGVMAKNLGVEPKRLTNIFQNGAQGVRMNYYPPCPKADKVVGISPHSDASALTILTQVNEVEGLQIRKNGNWVPIKPLRGGFIVNLGDAMEILSNRKYKSIEHRAVIDPEKERISIASFHHPCFNAMIGPLSELVKEDRAHFKTIKYDDHIKLFFASKLKIKGTFEFMKLEE